MGAPNLMRAVARCQTCRHRVLDTFASLAGVSLRPSPQSTSSKASRYPRATSSRSFTSSRVLALSSQEQQSGEESSPVTETSVAQRDPSIPWYLQVETPTPPAPVSPHLALQEIPPIPEDAPKILSPILNHLSVNAGLDNLSLLDLRHLDPPPALGANLIMILATARSYKHLNTSADRLCRWIRSRYKLQPYADGLLGRNELKLKLRRKARKLKLAQSVGNTVAMGDADDGITTGWICVNIGSVEHAKVPTDEQSPELVEDVAMTQEQQEEIETNEEEYQNPSDDGYIGFGSRSTAPRIVVQMFTEEKRLEMDLEGLWDVRMERKARKSEKIESSIRED